jgi:integrase
MATHKLTAMQVEKIKAPGFYGDGLGLWLRVRNGGESKPKKKVWVFRYMLNGLAHTMGLGATHTVSLAEARIRARQARQLILDGRDPLETKWQARDEMRALTAERILFKDAAQEFITLHAPTWKNEKHRAQWGSTLKEHAYPALGNRPVAAIDAALINDALKAIWTKTPETARRVKQRIERVIQWVKDGKPLPTRNGAVSKKHHKAMPFAEVPAFMAELRQRDSVSARALEFTILTATRTSEALNATWDEIDLDAGVWSIPGERMKAGKDHDVPLSGAVLSLLESLPRVGRYVFPGVKGPLSNMAMLELLRGMDGNGFTVHGFRSSFRDWAGDQTHFARETIEHAIAHQIKDKAEAAYRRSSALEKRRKLMEAWARFLASPMVSATVTPIGKAR